MMGKGFDTIVTRKKVPILLAFAVLATVSLFYWQYGGEPILVKVCLPNEIIEPEKMTSQQMLDYFEWPNRTSCRLTHDFGGSLLKNPSGLDGQKSVCLNPEHLAPPAGDCLVYSFGINDEWSFDEAMEKYGCQVYAFDPSMKAEDHDHTPAIHFKKLGLSNRDFTNDQGWKFFSLSSIYNMLKERHKDRVIDYLKMDIEYDEWYAIPQMVESGMMDKIRQLAIEIHLSGADSISQIQDRVRVLQSIEKSGMVRFDSKLNPWFKGEFKSLDLSGSFGYEIAWYNSKFLITQSDLS